jgi:hypothetical protein
VPRRYVRRRSQDDAAQEATGVGSGAPAVAIDPGDARLTELLIASGPDTAGTMAGAVPLTSVARLQRLAGNRAVADRLGGGGETVQRVRNRTSDDEEAIPGAAKPGPPETDPANAEPEAQAGSEVEAGPGAIPAADETPGAEIARSPEKSREQSLEKSLEKPAGDDEKPTGLDRVVDERLALFVGERERVLTAAEIEPAAAPAGEPVKPASAAAPETEPATAPEAASETKPEAASEAAPTTERTTAPAEGAAAPAIAEAPVAPVAEVPAGSVPEEPAPDESAPAPEPVAATAGEPAQESMPAGDLAQFAALDAAGAQAVATAAMARTAASRASRVAVVMAGVGFADVLRQTMGRAVRLRTAILHIAPTLAGKAGESLTTLRMAVGTAIQNIAGKVRFVADAAKGVIAWARQALGAARGAARAIAGQIRSALGGVGEAVLAFLSNLLAPARQALDRLLKAGADVLRDGVAKVRRAAANAVAFVRDEVATRLETLLAAAVELVGRLVRAALERARRVRAANDKRLAAARRRLGALHWAARGMLAGARATLRAGIAQAVELVATAIASGVSGLSSRRAGNAFNQKAMGWLAIVRSLRRSGRSRISEDTMQVTSYEASAMVALAAAQGEARDAYETTHASLTAVETTAATEAGELRASVGEAATTAASGIDAAVTEAEALIQDVAGDGDRDARELQGLVGRVGK